MSIIANQKELLRTKTLEFIQKAKELNDLENEITALWNDREFGSGGANEITGSDYTGTVWEEVTTTEIQNGQASIQAYGNYYDAQKVNFTKLDIN